MKEFNKTPCDMEKDYYIKEFELFDDRFITFNIYGYWFPQRIYVEDFQRVSNNKETSYNKFEKSNGVAGLK